MNLPSPSISLSPAYVDSWLESKGYTEPVCLSRFEFSSFFLPRLKKKKKKAVWNDTQCRILSSSVSTPADSRKKKGKIVNIAPMPLGFFFSCWTLEHRQLDNHLNGFIVVDQTFFYAERKEKNSLKVYHHRMLSAIGKTTSFISSSVTFHFRDSSGSCTSADSKKILAVYHLECSHKKKLIKQKKMSHRPFGCRLSPLKNKEYGFLLLFFR